MNISCEVLRFCVNLVDRLTGIIPPWPGHSVSMGTRSPGHSVAGHSVAPALGRWALSRNPTQSHCDIKRQRTAKIDVLRNQILQLIQIETSSNGIQSPLEGGLNISKVL
jgi:hypothetical protein